MTDKIKVVYCKPNERAQIIETSNDYASLCDLLGYDISTTMELITNKIVIVYNDEGKLDGSKPNRAIFQEDKLTDFKTKHKHQFIDFIAGSFIICGLNEDGELISLSEKQLSQYLKLFLYPEEISMVETGILIVRFREKILDLIPVSWADIELFN